MILDEAEKLLDAGKMIISSETNRVLKRETVTFDGLTSPVTFLFNEDIWVNYVPVSEDFRENWVEYQG